MIIQKEYNDLSKILVITDNKELYEGFRSIIVDPFYKPYVIDFACSAQSPLSATEGVRVIRIKQEVGFIIDNYDLVLSLHCKQLFPNELVNQVTCINIHPGYNPYNRGWYPQVFSIINKQPAGVTIHLIDEYLDHGPIIVQEQIELYGWDTSLDVYKRILKKEIEMLTVWMPRIITHAYTVQAMHQEGTINYKSDFNDLCQLNLDEKATIGECIDKLRALTHGDFKNAFFTDPNTGKKVYVSLLLTTE